MDVIGRLEAWSFELALWSTLITTRVVVGIAELRF
jgi:hypothetical protein